HEMGEVYETSLTARRLSDSEGNELPVKELTVEEDELLEPDLLREVEPEEESSGYTGNEGMTLERWYRHAAILVWPVRKHFEVLCGAGSEDAVRALAGLVKRWRQAGRKDVAALRADCVTFANAIVASWPETQYAPWGAEEVEQSPLLGLLAAIGEPRPVPAYPRQGPSQGRVAA